MSRSPRCRLLLGLVLALSSATVASGQRQKIEVPKPEPLTLETKDRVLLRCTYYPGGVIQKSRKEDDFERKAGKEVVPIVLLHGWEGRGAEFDALAIMLQHQGHAVVVPDLRGHGGSTTRRLPNGSEQTLNRDRFRSADLLSMILDVDAVKQFLLDKNNSGDLNIELLCVIGSEMGANIALNWARRDWSWPQLPSFKQGMDVKSLVLLSPQRSFKGMAADPALQHPAVRAALSVLIIVGAEDSSGQRDAKRIHSRLEPFHQNEEEQDLVLFEPETSLSGTKLVNPRAGLLPVFQNIVVFIERRLVRRSGVYPWSERKNPLDIE